MNIPKFTFLKNPVLLLSLFIFLLSCKEVEVSNSHEIDDHAKFEESVDEGLVNEIFELEQISVSAAYMLLNPGEKAMFWNKHLNTIINSGRFSDRQVEHIKILQDLVSVDLFSRVGTIELELEMDDFSREWIGKSDNEQLFTPEQLIEIATINGIGKQISNQSITGSRVLAKTKCDCRYSLGCPDDNCHESDDCTKKEFKSYTCGILGTSRCTGRCGVQPEEEEEEP